VFSFDKMLLYFQIIFAYEVLIILSFLKKNLKSNYYQQLGTQHQMKAKLKLNNRSSKMGQMKPTLVKKAHTHTPK
jgi:hypothetical protein